MDDDLASWTEERLELEIQELLPSDQTLVCKLSEEDRCWVVSFETGEGTVVWSSSNIDRRLALFDAYGVLWNPQPSDGVWTVGVRPTRVSVQQHVYQQYGDPEDLDPDEIESVYGVKKRS